MAAAGAEWLAIGPRPVAHQATMLTLHAINVGLLVILARRVDLGWRRALVAGALMALGPARLDVALSLHARCDLLVTALVLGATILWTVPRRVASLVGALVLAALACATKETAFAMVALVVALDRPRTRPVAATAMALCLGALFAIRWAVIGGPVGEYLAHQRALLPGARGVAEGAAVAVLPFARLLAIGRELRGAWSPAGYTALRLAALAVFAVAAGYYLLRILAPSRARSIGIALAAGGLLGCAGFVNTRAAYLPATGVCLLIALAPLPRVRLASGAAAAALCTLAVLCALRFREWIRIDHLAAALHRAAVTEARAVGATRLFLIGAPDSVAGIPASPTSECFRMIDRAEPAILPLGRGVSRRGAGPRVVRDGDRITLAAEPGELELIGDYCDPRFTDGAPVPVVAVCDAAGSPTLSVTLDPATTNGDGFALWQGGETLTGARRP